MNIVAGNCAGAFSGFLAQLSWMEIASQPENQISLQLHTRNKTQYHGNSYSNYRWFNSKDCNNFNEVIEENLLLKFFKKNQYITTDLSTDCIYTECYPSDIKDIITDLTEMRTEEGPQGRVIGYFFEKPCVVQMRNPQQQAPNGNTKKAGFEVSLFRGCL